MTSKFDTPYAFIKNAWLDIPCFLKFVRTLPKGQQFQFLNYVEKTFNGEWWQTITFNSTDAMNSYRNFCKRLGVKTDLPPFDRKNRNRKFSGTSRHRMVTQGIGDTMHAITDLSKASQGMKEALFEASASFSRVSQDVANASNRAEQTFSKASVVLDNFNGVGDKLGNFIDRSNFLVEQFNEIVNTLVNKVSDYSSSSLVPSLIVVIAKFFALGYLLTHPSNQNVASIVALLTLIVPVNWTGLYSLANNLLRAIQGLVGKVFSQDGESDKNIVLSFFELIRSIFQGLFSTLDDAQFKEMSLSSHRIRVISDTIRSAHTIFDFISKLVIKIIEAIGDKCLTTFGWLPWFAKDRSIDPLIDEFEKIKVQKIDERCQVSKAAALRVIALHDALVSAEAKLQKRFMKGTNEMRSVLPYMRMMIKNLADTMSLIPEHFKNGKNPRRVKPFWVYIYGEPRIGKSAILQPYIVNALARSLQLTDQYEDYTNYTYFRNCGEEYWEGYYGQQVLWYNDLFQNHADEQAMNNAVMELTNVVDDNLFPLNMAFERKHGVYFDSELVVSNAQDDIVLAGFIKHKCWSGGSHLFARRNVVLEMTLNSKYKDASGTGYDVQKVKQEMLTNPSNCVGKVNPLFPKDMYIIYEHDNLDGSVKGAYSFEQCIEHLQRLAAQYKQSQNVFKDKLYGEFAAMWCQSNDARPTRSQIHAYLTEHDVALAKLPVEEVQRRIFSGQKLAWVGDIILDISCLPLDVENIETDIGNALWGYVKDTGEFLKIIEALAIGTMLCERQTPHLLTTDQLDLDEVENVEAVPRPSCCGEVEQFYDCLPTMTQKQKDMDELTAKVCEQARALFPDFLQAGWTEGTYKMVCEKITIPDVARTRECPGASKLVDHVTYGKYFVGHNTETEEQMRILIVVDTIGQAMFDNMRDTKTFCERMRSAVTKYKFAVTKFIYEHPWLRALMVGAITGALMVGLQTALTKIIAYTISKHAPTYYDLAAITSKMTDAELERFRFGVMMEQSKRSSCGDCSSQTAEGKITQPKKQVKRVPKNKVKTQSYDAQNQVIENIVKNQICKFRAHVVHDGGIVDQRMYGSGLCVGGDVFVLPDHFMVRWTQLRDLYRAKGDEFVVTLMWSQEQTVDLDWDSIVYHKLPYQHCDDLCFIRIKDLIQMKKIHKFFQNEADNPSLFEAYLFGKRAGDFTCGVTSLHRTEMARQVYEHPERIDSIYGEVLAGRQIEIPICYRYYEAKTINGDCGTLLFCTDSRLNCRKILGMHTAGGNDAGVSSIIFQEDILEAFDYFAKEKIVVTIEDDLKPVEDKAFAQELENIGLRVAGELPDLVIPGYPVKRRPKICLPRKTNIRKSLVYDVMSEDFGPSKVGPAKLRPFKDCNGQVISPLMVGLKKMTKVSPMVNQKIASAIQKHMVQSIKQWNSPYNNPRLLTEDEVVNGFGNLNPVEMKTSPGYPYVLLDNTKGKIPFFEQKEDQTWQMGPLVKERYDFRECQAKKGIVVPTYFIATLKDETRPLEKVSLGKTRIFQISPVDFNLLLRKYFGYFIAHCHATYLNGEMAVGINANSYEWTLMIKHMMEVGSRFINGDGENFDASTGQQYSMYNVDVINAWYNDGEENAQVRRILYITFLNAKNIIGRVVVVLFQGNQSGIYITTIFNNMTGMFAVRYTYLRCGYDLSTFHAMVRNKDYGDDDLICVNACVGKFTFYEHQRTMSLLGIKYTTAQKTEIKKDYFAVTEITFLKRAFVLQNGIYLPRMPLEVIYEIPRWSESDETRMDDQMNRFNASLLEASNYSYQVYSELYNAYEEYCYLLQGDGHCIDATQLFSFERCFNIKFPEISGVPLQPACDRSLGRLPIPKEVRNLGGSDSEQSGKPGELISCSLSLYLTASDFETQTAEGSTKPPIKQIVRIVKTQADEPEIDDFQCELVVLEKLKEIMPAMSSLYSFATNQLHRRTIRVAARRLCRTVVALYHVYEQCKNSYVLPDMITQSDDSGPSIQRTDERSVPVESTPGIEKVDVGPTEEGQDVVEEKTTIFKNDQPPHQPNHVVKRIPRDWVSVRDINLEQFYERPYILEEFQWGPGNDGKLLKTFSFPSSIYQINALAKKMAGICFARPDIEIEVLCNASTFNYGTLTFSVIPMPNRVSNAYRSVHSCTTWPQWYEISAGGTQNLKFIIPYQHYRHTTSILRINDASEWSRNWAELAVYITSPLMSVSVATPPPVGVTVIARLVRPQFCGLLTQGEQESMSKQTLNTLQRPLGPVTTALRGVSSVTDQMSKITATAGWSIPPGLQATNPMQIRAPLLAKTDDLPCSIVLGPSQSASLDKNLSCVNGQPDDMMFSNFIDHPAMIDRVSWTRGLSSGKEIWSANIDSNLFQNKRGASDGVQFPTPLGFLLNAHTYWRGSIKLCIRVIASCFHTGRIRLTYTPTWETGIVNTITSANIKNVTIDINGTSDTIVEIPYDTEKPWMCTEFPDVAGIVKLIVINPLSAATVEQPQEAFIKIYAWGGPDFQLARPRKSKIIPDLKYVTPPTMVTQSEERVMRPCELPASSADCMRKAKSLWLGSEDRRQKLGAICHPYVYTSIKQSINMLTPIARYKTDATKAVCGYWVDPLYGKQADAYEGETWNNYLMYYRTVYYFARGGFRCVVAMEDGMQCTVDVIISDNHAGATGEHDQTKANHSWLWPIDDTTPSSLDVITSAGAYFSSSAFQPVDVVVPYWSSYANLCLGMGMEGTNAHGTTPIDGSLDAVGTYNCALFSISNQKTARYVVFFVAGADDLMFGVRRAIPRCLTKKATDSGVVLLQRTIPYTAPTQLKMTLVDVKTQDGVKIYCIEDDAFVTPVQGMIIEHEADFTQRPIKWNTTPEKVRPKIQEKVKKMRVRRSLFYNSSDEDVDKIVG